MVEILFENLGIKSLILENLAKKGFTNPTSIQAKAIPLILDSSKDVVALAQTGTGKTAAYGLPLIQKINSNANDPQALVLVPTRELAIQVAEELKSFSHNQSLLVATIYGGQPINIQSKLLAKKPHIIVGTPGRIIDHYRSKRLVLANIQHFVLDEADEMFSKGFSEDIEIIFKATNHLRRTYLFSATMPSEILKLAKKYMQDFVEIKAEAANTLKSSTEQIFYEVDRTDLVEALARVLESEIDMFAMVFCRTKRDVDLTAESLIKKGFAAEGIHGDLSQSQRNLILTRFRSRKFNILVATDVAARGIDIQDLTHVINLALPQDPESYVHRIGRTGRAGKEGKAITIITPAEFRRFNYFQKKINTKIKKARIPTIDEVLKLKKSHFSSKIERQMANSVDQSYLDIAKKISGSHDKLEVIAKLLKHNFESTNNVKHLKNIKDMYNISKSRRRSFQRT